MATAMMDMETWTELDEEEMTGVNESTLGFQTRCVAALAEVEAAYAQEDPIPEERMPPSLRELQDLLQVYGLDALDTIQGARVLRSVVNNQTWCERIARMCNAAVSDGTVRHTVAEWWGFLMLHGIRPQTYVRA